MLFLVITAGLVCVTAPWVNGVVKFNGVEIGPVHKESRYMLFGIGIMIFVLTAFFYRNDWLPKSLRATTEQPKQSATANEAPIPPAQEKPKPLPTVPATSPLNPQVFATPKESVHKNPPVVQQSCPAGNCIGGDNYGNPTVNNMFGTPRRDLSPKQRAAFIEVLKPACPFAIAVRPLPGNEEAMAFAEKLKRAISDAGCSLARPKFLIDTAISYGVSVVVHADENFPPGAEKLSDALAAGGLKPTRQVFDALEPDIVYLMVGASETPADIKTD